ncbi:MAG: hypothetical protein WCU00_03880 [Candidatus Latescibacterota bacterium]
MKKQILIGMCFLGLSVFVSGQAFSEKTPAGTSWVTSHGYSGCVQLDNGNVRVVLEPNCGGRVLEYSLKGKNVLYVDPKQDGMVYTPGKPFPDPCGGRCDFGPEVIVPRHPDLWLGKWTAEITGPYSARMTSVEDKNTGVQLIRDYTLDKNSSHLKFTQTIKNISKETKQYCHWSRTFGEGGGICLVPISPNSRFPKGFIIYGPGAAMTYVPENHPSYSVRDNFLIITGEPPQAKFGLDSMSGWLSYITRSNLLFVKKFPVYPDRPYMEMASLTISLYYYKDQECELEPIGPKETIKPGKTASFTEDWWLFSFPYPSDKQVDLKVLDEVVKKNTGK